MYCAEKKAWARSVLLFLVIVFSTMESVAFADDEMPASCTGGYEEIAYNAGWTSGSNLVAMAWAMVNDCSRIEYFEYVIKSNIDRLTVPPWASPDVACRYAGYVNGTMHAIYDIYQECEIRCYNDGTIIGEFSAKMYCDLSLAFNGLSLDDDFIRAPVQLCGYNFEFACDFTFMYVTFTYSNALGFCEPYTRDPYFEVWDQARNNQCAYDIIYPPPPPPPPLFGGEE